MNSARIILAAAVFSGAASAAELTLDESIDFALERSPAAVAAEATYISARADLYQGWGGISPTVSATYSASRYYDRNTFRVGGYEIPGYEPPLHYYYSSARLDQPVFAGGRLGFLVFGPGALVGGTCVLFVGNMLGRRTVGIVPAKPMAGRLM